MGTFLLLLFIFLFVIPVCRIIWRVYLLNRDWKRATRQMNDVFRTAAGQQASSAPRQPRKRKKKIDPNVGEYVAFEEIHETDTIKETTSASGTHIRVESQIEDAVWEEIK